MNIDPMEIENKCKSCDYFSALSSITSESKNDPHKILDHHCKKCRGMSCLYFMSFKGSLEDGKKYPVKIGFTKKINQRCSNLQTGNPVQLIPFALFFIDNPKNIETEIHKFLLSENRKPTIDSVDWFMITASEMLQIITQVQKKYIQNTNRIQ